MEMDPAESSLDSSLEAPVISDNTVPQDLAEKSFRRFNLLRGNRAAFFIATGSTLLIVILSAGGWALTLKNASKDVTQTTNSQGSDYTVSSLPLNGISSSDQLQLAQAASLEVNGQLKVNDSIIIKPGTAPANPVDGQIYFDKATNQPYFYDGTSFLSLAQSTTSVSIPAHVSSIGGQTGAIKLGAGLVLNNGTLTLSSAVLQATTGVGSGGGSTQVSSVQGQTGAVSFRAGSGIDINGTTITNTGVLSIGGSTGALSLGRGLTMQGGAIKSTISLTSGSPNLVVTDDGNGNMTISDSGPGGTVVTLGPASPETDATNNSSIAVNKTGSGNFLQFQSNGVDKFVVDQTGKITVGSINYSQVVGAPASTVTSIGGVSGAIGLGSGLSISGSTLSNSGVTQLTGTVNQVIVSSSTGNITLSLPQDIAVASSPNFASLGLSGNLSVSGTSSFASDVNLTGIAKLTVASGATSLGGTLGVTGAVTASSTLSVAGNATLSGTLGVTGASTFTGLGTFNGGIAVGNNSNFTQTGLGSFSTGTGAVSLNGNTSVAGSNSFTTGTGTVTLGSLGSGLVQSGAGGALSSGTVDRNSATYFVNGLNVANGGTGANTFAANGVLYGNGVGAVQATAAGASAQLLLANALGVPTFTTLSGDVSITAVGATTVSKLQGTTLSLSGLANGQVVQYNGANLVNGYITNTNLAAGSFSNITGTGALSSGSIAAGFGTIATGNNITTTAVVQGATVTATGALQGNTLSINSGAFAVNSSGAITATTGITTTGGYTQSGAGANNFSGTSTFTSNVSQTGAGSFSTGTGAVTLNGNTSVSGSNTFTVGTGATTLGGTLGVTGAGSFIEQLECAG